METRSALLLACFFLSGFAGLLYETAWTREFGFVFGTSELAVAAVLAAYMGGLALGAAAAGHLAPRLRRPVLAYGVLELSIAACALAVPTGIRLVTLLYVSLLGGGSFLPEGDAPPAVLLQLLGAFAVLVPPTALMGATLPLLARHVVRRESEIGSRVGLLYAVNTAGAIAGTLCAAFVLMPELGLRRTVYAGAAVNAVVFAAAAALARGRPLEGRAAGARAGAAMGPGWILPAVAVSGAVSFAYEVLWTRLLGHVVGSSVHAFATMLASFLFGIALGSAMAARLARTPERAARGFAAAQLGIALAAYATFSLADRLPSLARGLGVGPGSSLASAGVAVGVLLPITLCVGATFPFAVRLLALRPEQAAAASARVYAWNTVGAIAGSLGAGFLLLPGLGFAGTVAAGAAANLGLAAFAALRVRPVPQPRLALAAAALALLGVVAPPHPPWTLLRTSPFRHTSREGEVAYAAVGRSATVVLLDQGPHWRLLSNGLPEAKVDRPEAHPVAGVPHWLGLLPALARPEARQALLVGLGGGVTLEALPSTFERVDVVELESEIVAANRAISAARARDPLADPRVRLHVGDARGALLLTGARYDAVISQPSHPWTSGSSHLYTREFFSLVESRLRPGGVFVQWVGMFMVDAPLLQTLVAALLDVFSYLEVYQPHPLALLFVASDTPVEGVAGARAALGAAPGDFARYGIHRPEDVAAALVLDSEGARAFAAGAAPNSDDRNELAMRASRLGTAELDPWTLYSLLDPHDPLKKEGGGTGGLHRSALIRRLVARRFLWRAEALAAAGQGAAREAGEGWVELGRGRPRRAAGHFMRARALDPTDGDALAGLVASRRSALARGEPLTGVVEEELSGPVAAVVAAWRRERDGAAGVAALDAELARLRPGDALFEEAARLRVEWRMAAGEPAAAAEALAIADTLVTWGGRPFEDVLLRARAAAAAGRPATAWGALSHLAEQLTPDSRGWKLARRALEIADGLPPGPAAEVVRARLAERAR